MPNCSIPLAEIPFDFHENDRRASPTPLLHQRALRRYEFQMAQRRCIAATAFANLTALTRSKNLRSNIQLPHPFRANARGCLRMFDENLR